MRVFHRVIHRKAKIMITALMLNPCIDRTVFIDGFLYGEMNRIVESENIPSGKGTNVALAIKKLGGLSQLIMFGAKENDPVKSRLSEFNIDCKVLGVFDSIRVNTKLNNTQDNVITEINEKGAMVSPEQIEKIIKMSVEAAKESEFFVLTGSMPKGCDSSLYGEIMAKIKLTAPECKLVLDAEGDAFKHGIIQKPYVIKPNKYEIELHCGKKLDTMEDVAREGMKLHKDGVEYVIISMGAQGAMICTKDGALYAKTPKVDVINTVGAGDSLLSSSILAIEKGLMAEDVLKHAVAAGCAAVSCTNSELINREIYEKLIDCVEVININI